MINMTELEKQDLRAALDKALDLVKSTVAWAEARKFTDAQEYIEWEDKLNKLSVKDHAMPFGKYMD